MKPAMTLDELIKVPSFGRNALLTAAIQSLENSNVLSVSLIERNNKKKLSIRTRVYKDDVDEFGPIFTREIVYDKENPKVKELFENFINGNYHSHGKLDAELFKVDFNAVQTELLTKRLAYGTDPELTSITMGDNDLPQISFTTLDANGKRKQHVAYWNIPDIGEDYNKVIIVHRKSYTSNSEFLDIISKVLEIEKSRIRLENGVDVTTETGELINVLVDPSDLSYRGHIGITIKPGEGPTRILDKLSGDLKITNEPEAPSGEEEIDDPEDQIPDGGTSEGDDAIVPPPIEDGEGEDLQEPPLD